MPSTKYKEDFCIKLDLEPFVKSGCYLSLACFQSKIVELYSNIRKIRTNMRRLGLKLGVNLSQKYFVVESCIYLKNLWISSVSCIEKHFQDIILKVSTMQYDLNKFFKHDEETPRGLPGVSRGLPIDRNTENRGNQTPNPKSDIKNCLTYVRNQCGQHSQREMANLLYIGRATFLRKIKGQNIELVHEGNKDCEFCKRKIERNSGNNILPSPSISVLTNDMKEHLKNACNRHKHTEIAKKLEIKISTLRSYTSRNSIVFTNEDPTKCYFCEPADDSDIFPSLPGADSPPEIFLRLYFSSLLSI